MRIKGEKHMEMTITRGLAELKLLDARINSAIQSTQFIGGKKKSSAKVTPTQTVDEFNQSVQSAYASVNKLIENRKVIKSAIVDSNAKTMVKIGEIEMTVADAIERKDSIKYDQMFLNQMINHFNQAVGQVNRENEKVQMKLDELLVASFGKEQKGKTGDNEIEAIAKPFLQQNEFEIVDPLKLKDKIDKLQFDIQGFTSEVDYVLSESNSLNRISVNI
jgi:hypothetical protein